MNTLNYALSKNPIIASITDENDFQKALESKANIIILIQADINSLKSAVEQVAKTNKIVFVHMDLIKGLKRDESSIRFLAEQIGIDGIVTTHANLIRVAKNHNLLTIQRVFILDSASIDQGIRLINNAQPDAVEVLPGVVVPHISEQLAEIPQTIIAAGLINTKEEINHILKNGAEGISSSSSKLWNSLLHKEE